MRLLKQLRLGDNFSEAERSIAAYMLKHPKEIVNLSIRQLAAKTYTSSATVFRLCQKLDFKGFAEFKIRFISEVNRISSFDHPVIDRPITDQDDAASVSRKIAALEIEAIEETRNEMNRAQLERVAGYLDHAKLIDMYAFDVNHQIAEMTAYNFQQLRKTVLTRPSVESQYLQAMDSTQEHVAVLLSRTGENQHLIRIAKLLRERRIRTVLFSTRRESTLVGLCDEFLYVANVEDSLDMGGLIFSIGVRYYQDVFYGMILARHYQDISKNYDAFSSVVGRLGDKNKIW